MLVLSRRVGEVIVINGDIQVVVLEAHRDRVRLGIEAPASVRVNRAEVQNRVLDSVVPVPAMASRELVLTH